MKRFFEAAYKPLTDRRGKLDPVRVYFALEIPGITILALAMLYAVIMHQ